MKKSNILKHFLFLLMLVGTGILVFSCSSEDEKQQAFEVSFKTTNEKGSYSTVFSNEENILFDLNITNNTGDTLTVNGNLFLDEILSSFKLYSSNGAFIGYPFNGIDLLKFQATASNFKPHESRSWQCLYMTHLTEMDYQSPFESKRLKDPLSQGEYYLLYSLTLGKETKTGKLTFKIE